LRASTHATALAAALCLFLALTVPADARAGRDQWRALSRGLAAPWPGIQAGDGSLPDALHASGQRRYGNGILGLGLLQTGLREHRADFVRAGLRAVTAETRRRHDTPNVQEFRIWSVAGAYSLVKRRLRDRRSGRLALRRWAPWLRRQRSFWLRRAGFQNKVLVEAVAALELLRTGLVSDLRGAILGGARRRTLTRVVRLVNRDIPRRVPRAGAVLSDPRGSPPAYHALSYAMYARAVGLLGRRASARARAVLGRLAETTSWMTAPNGDVAYWGRSQAEAWTLSGAAYALAATAARSSAAAAQRYRSVSDRLLERLSQYGVGPRGEWIVPSVRQDLVAGRRSLDRYAHAPEYAGLTLVYLNWALPLLPRVSSSGGIPADRDMHAVVGRGRGRFAVVRQGPLWYAVRQRATGGLRYDFGPVAARRLEAGGWRDLVPLRPSGHGSAGPRLEVSGYGGLPVATSLVAGPGGRVLMQGGFQLWGDWVRLGVSFELEPAGCGLAMTFSARAGDVYRFTSFFPGVEAGTQGEGYARVGDRVVRFSEPLLTAGFGAGRPSVSDATLTMGAFSLRAPEDGPLRIVLC
jgi:hypothetical protein